MCQKKTTMLWLSLLYYNSPPPCNIFCSTVDLFGWVNRSCKFSGNYFNEGIYFLVAMSFHSTKLCLPFLNQICRLIKHETIDKALYFFFLTNQFFVVSLGLILLGLLFVMKSKTAGAGSKNARALWSIFGPIWKIFGKQVQISRIYQKFCWNIHHFFFPSHSFPWIFHKTVIGALNLKNFKIFQLKKGFI